MPLAFNSFQHFSPTNDRTTTSTLTSSQKMSSMTQSASLQPLFERFTENFYDAGCPVVRKEFESFVKDFLQDLPEVEKKTSARASTKPGEEFQSQLCRCRIWNNGLAKQCSYKPKEDGVCTYHTKKIEETSGDWAFGFYDEEQPTTYLCDYGKKESGAVLKWKSDEPSDKTELLRLKEAYQSSFGKSAKGPKANDIEWLKTKLDERSSSEEEKTETELLKEDFKKVFGKSPKGPKANNIEWLKSKIEAETSEDELESSDDEKTKTELLKEEFKKVLGKSPKGPKANDDAWLKSKIDEFNAVPSDDESSDDDSSDEESSDDDSSDDDSSDEESSDGKGTGLKSVGPIEFRFEGVSYTRIIKDTVDREKVWKVEDEYGNEVGEWVKAGGNDGGYIIWEEKCWEDIHKDHDDYIGTLQSV